jgi:site-specific DNA-methyltransferase (adenine-specific)
VDNNGDNFTQIIGPSQNVVYQSNNGVLIHDDCTTALKTMCCDSIDLIVTSPPYNCGIEYDSWDDEQGVDEYLGFCYDWLRECKNILRPGGRICVNVLVDAIMDKRTVRVSPFAEIYNLMLNIGYKFAGFPIWVEPNRSKNTAWGSWKSAAAPYIYTPCEVVIIGYKGEWKREGGENTISKEQFIEGVGGIWKFRPETQQRTKANFPIELPKMCINLLSFKGDVVLDPFMGSGTTAMAAIETDRKFIGIDISKNYCDKAIERINERSAQQTLFEA